MTLPTPYVDVVLDAVGRVGTLLGALDQDSWLLMSEHRSMSDPRRRAAMFAARDLAHAHARGALLDHVVQTIRRAAYDNPMVALLPDPEASLEALDGAAAAIVVSDLVTDQELAVLTATLRAAATAVAHTS